jgi:predicted nucleic acid-binding protein
MTGRSFVDTNVLAYVYDRGSGFKRELAKDLVSQRLDDQSLVLSAQVLNELASTLLKPAFGLSLDEVRLALRTLSPATTVELDLNITLRALDARARYQVSLWDGLIIAAAERARCSEILSEDLNHGQEYFGIVVRNPFLNAVSES